MSFRCWQGTSLLKKNMDLITASKYGNLNLIRSILEQGVDNTPRRHQDPLVLCERCTHKNGTRENNSDKLLYEALFAASQYGYFDVVKCLVEQGKANLFHKEDLNTPLHIACAMGRSDIAIYLAATTATKERTTSTTRSDFSAMSALEHLDREGNPPHVSACCNGNMEIARHLIETYPEIICVNKGYGPRGLAPIHWAARINHANLATFLLEDRHADVNLKASKGQTALHFACRRRFMNPSAQYGAVPVVDVLLQHGADLYATNEDGNTPLLEAVKWNQTDVVRRLLAYMQYFYNTGTTPIHNRYIHHVNAQGHNALSLACSNQNLEIIQMLLVQGACVFNEQGWQALTTACEANHADIVHQLVAARLGQQQGPPVGRGRGSLTGGKRKRRSCSMHNLKRE